ncbi:hypothetical protein HDU81_010114 [Chytriomyces hyalinus]|nr:hypothetical protein HDU81_010114 [Chytriomyces hyalinus]
MCSAKKSSKSKKDKDKKKKKEKKSKKKSKKKAESSDSSASDSDESGEVRYSAITGKKIKLKVPKSKQDKVNDINRQDLRRMLNECFD